MAKYLVESHDWQLFHGGATTDGALGQGGGSEKIYLHLIEVSDDDIARLVPRVDENDNRDHSRLALPNNDEWWVPVDGKKAYPKTFNPKVISRCLTGGDGIPKAQPVGGADLALLKKAGAKVD